VRYLAAVLVTLALSGCETTAEKSVKLERAAKKHEAQTERATAAAQRELTIAHASTKVAVTGVTLLHSSEGLAAVVTLQSHSRTALREVPIRVTVRDAAGHAIYTNETPGQSSALISASLIPAGGRLEWIDDQIPSAADARGATAEVGEAPPAGGGAPPKLTVSGAHMIEDPSSGPGAEGYVVNHSAIAQSELVVYAVARRGTRIVAAGRAVLPQAPAGASTRFQLFFIGSPQGARLEVSAPASTLG
jgi:hypothetical protein